MWYERIVNTILETNTDVLFIIDPTNMLDFPDIHISLNGVYDLINYNNELGLRRTLRKVYQKTIIKFIEESQIPYDLYSSQATINIGPIDVFPLLNENVLSKIPFEEYQRIFIKYENEKHTIFDKLSDKDTKSFLDSVIYVEDIGIKERVLELNDQIIELINKNELYPDDWGRISKFYGELKYLISSKNLNSDTNNLDPLIRFKFKEFISNQYQDMIFNIQSPLNSNIINMIFENIPTALICFDCMGFEEWNVIKSYLNGKLSIKFDENYSFSMIPSDTSFSRTSLFSGLLPVQIHELNIKNKNEEKLFKESLRHNYDILGSDVYFKRCSSPLDIPTDFAFEDFKAVAIIFSFIDEFVHGKNMNKTYISTLLEKYLEQNYLDLIIQSLVNKGFFVYFSSDHGNIYAEGNGLRPKKDLFKSRSRRYLISNHENILDEYKTSESILIQFKEIIGEDYFLLLTDNSMFNTKGTSGLTHGGISVEEVVVPFIEVKKE
jgi:hypothetical protein